MGSTEKEQTTQHHPPHISSLVVRPSGSNDREDGRNAAGDYEPGEVSRDRPSFNRSDRYKGDNGGHRTRASSSSPGRRGYEDHKHGSDLNHSGVPPRGRELSSRREAPGRHRDYSPPLARGGAGARPYRRGLDGPEPPHGRDGMSRNNISKVQPREGDWYCLDPLCRNLNFARRESCYKCKRHRYAPANSPPLPRLLPPPMNHSPRRDFNGYRSPPRGWPRDYPPPRHDHPTWRDRERDRPHYSDHEYPPSRRIASDWAHTEPLPKPHYDRRPPLSPPRGGRWGRVLRERSRSPPLRDVPPPPLRDGPPPSLRGGGPPLHRDYRRDSHFDRERRDDGRGGRGRMGNSY
ncbi:putative protein [Arabidopsis thaliana]|uniref:At4g28990 n=4 Tax=Arabidopsis TaxID=3701 RepID=Q9SZD0_ARATH|nr:RNA-binding protein-like protein [Arabidopsis thaliana]KAG7617729.1 Zinc finger RanBP2-type superfamily [Arabidopsis thaliana x Arabidopsis arenosa]KAG7622191.1 Zinc finger RanBP2-type superfamily [Arabidopsis suecica]ABJ17140.1 At4g28990 [Arabidopsis thaliana]AEE85569.1 RNA-binding protein-like protein [Arabidopsis thaliana]OAO98659.1 hypothetical protein AXX17_AT4G33310 [Arabidopsis thaliana]|eukprot:NP_194628.1 RNA-binding protein-like protein [Arabidopsis thaliana]